MEASNDIEKLKFEHQKSLEEVRVLNEKLKFCEESHQINEELLHSLVEAAAGKIGQDFFDNIVIRLSEWLNAECVLIGKIVENETIQAVPLYLDGKILSGFSYVLTGTPCEITTRKGYCEFPENAKELFPDDKILIDINGEAYIGTALYNKAGEINGVICAVSRKKMIVPPYARDILKIIGSRVTAEIERIKTEEALKQSESQLKESNATKDKLFSVIAHDLRNPFNTIIGFTELLLKNIENYDTEKQRKYLGIISQTSKGAYTLLENLLIWALSQRNLLNFNPEKLNLKVLASESTSLIFSMAREKDITISNNILDNIEVKADRQMVSAIIRNLLSNAIKFTPKGGSINLSAFSDADSKKNAVKIMVEDTGIGIEPEKLHKLFSIDKNCIEEGNNSGDGTGLGLIICKDFVERHGGSISVSSNPGEGSKFIFSLEVA